VNCLRCGRAIEDEAYYDGVEGYYCEACIGKIIAAYKLEADAFAAEQCRLTRRPLPEYDPSLEYRCTPEQYAAGDRASYSPAAYLAAVRHEATNYDELIAPPDRDSVRDRVFYDAIYRRIMQMIESAMDEDEVIVEDDTFDDEG
jgi:hypothetical protein